MLFVTLISFKNGTKAEGFDKVAHSSAVISICGFFSGQTDADSQSSTVVNTECSLCF